MDKMDVALHISEHSSLRQEILLRTQMGEQTVLYSLFANAVIFGWISSQDHADFRSLIAAALPFIITMIAYGVFKYHLNATRRVGQYLILMEKQLRFQNLSGWEHFLEGWREGKTSKSWERNLRVLFILQFILSVYIFSYVFVGFLR